MGPKLSNMLIPPNNEQNEPTQGDIGEIRNESTQAQCNEFEEIYSSANEELYPGCDFITPLDFMESFRILRSKHLQFSLGCGTETDEGLTKSFTFTTKLALKGTSLKLKAKEDIKYKSDLLVLYGTWVQSAKLESGWKVHMGLYFTKLPREASSFSSISISESSSSSPSESEEIDSTQTEAVLRHMGAKCKAGKWLESAHGSLLDKASKRSFILFFYKYLVTM
ncbi:hypothetical protein Tco_1273628 [Tanacetum coccineum]